VTGMMTTVSSFPALRELAIDNDLLNLVRLTFFVVIVDLQVRVVDVNRVLIGFVFEEVKGDHAASVLVSSYTAINIPIFNPLFTIEKRSDLVLLTPDPVVNSV
jgi:hypothetical protein